MVCMSYIRLWLMLWTPCGALRAYSTSHVGGAVSPLHCCTCTGPPSGTLCIVCWCTQRILMLLFCVVLYQEQSQRHPVCDRQWTWASPADAR